MVVGRMVVVNTNIDNLRKRGIIAEIFPMCTKFNVRYISGSSVGNSNTDYSHTSPCYHTCEPSAIITNVILVCIETNGSYQL